MTIVCLNWTASTKTARTMTTEVDSYLTGVYQTVEDQNNWVRMQHAGYSLWWREEDAHIHEYLVSGEPTYEAVREHSEPDFLVIKKNPAQVLTEWTH